MEGAGEYTGRMAAFAAGYGGRGLPAEVIERAKEIVLDTIGAILLGSRPAYRGVSILGDLAKAAGDGTAGTDG